jgi:hypothetical protein
MVLGPGYLANAALEEKRNEYQQGLLDEYNCFIYIPPIPNQDSNGMQGP